MQKPHFEHETRLEKKKNWAKYFFATEYAE